MSRRVTCAATLFANLLLMTVLLVAPGVSTAAVWVGPTDVSTAGRDAGVPQIAVGGDGVA
ncbi:MAG: hypothetical protein JWM98_1566, partial [Thermoleophilia bacterium]|nr:hypothetical protein [Thermoleophilia bacterium]